MDEKSYHPEKDFRNINSKPFSRKLLIIFLSALLVRLLFSLLYWVDKPLTHDAQEYLLLAENVASGKGYAYEIKPGDRIEHHERAPVYPLFLALVIKVFGKNYVVLKILQSVFASFLPLIILGIGKRLFSTKAAITAAWITVFYPPLVWGTAEFLSESLFTVLAMTGFYYLAVFSKSSRIPSLIYSSIWFLIAAHTKPVMLIGLPFIILWLLFRKEQSRPLKNQYSVIPAEEPESDNIFLINEMPDQVRHDKSKKCRFFKGLQSRIGRSKAAVIFCVISLLLIIPWTVRNYIVEKKFILVASEGGITFWTGNNALAVGDGDMAANPPIKRANNEMRKKHGYPSPAEMEKIYYRESFKFIKENPASFILLLAKKAFYFWFPVGRSMSLFSFKHQLASHLSYFPVLFLAILAAVNLLKKRKMSITPLISILSGMLACIIFFPQERYRIPLTDPFLILFAAYYLSEIINKAKKT